MRLIACPFHDGLTDVGRGRGPAAILAAAGLDAERVGPPEPGLPEAARVFAVARDLAERVRAAHRDGELPVVLAGDCNSCLGTVAGCGTAELGVVWLDAHADVDEPVDSASGSLDAMGLALMTGRGWDALRATVPGLEAVDEARVVLAGARDLEPGQRARVERGRIRLARRSADLGAALDALRADVPRAYLHLDLDVLDPGEGIANAYAAPDGWAVDELLGAVAATRERFDVVAVALTAYDPGGDRDGRIARAAAAVLEALSRP